MNPAGVTCNTKVFLSQIASKAVQSLGRPFSCLPLVSFLSPFFVQSCVQITLPWNKENCKVIGMKKFGIWTCSQLTNPHPIFHCYYNNAEKQCAVRTPAATLPVRALTRDKAGAACQADAGRGAENVTSGTHERSQVLCEQKKCAGDPPLPPCGCTKPSPLCSLLPRGCTSHPACYGCTVTTPKRVCSLLCKIKTEPFIMYLKRKLHEKPRFYFLSTSLLPELEVI